MKNKLIKLSSYIVVGISMLAIALLSPIFSGNKPNNPQNVAGGGVFRYSR